MELIFISLLLFNLIWCFIKILIVDDDYTILRLYSLILEDLGFKMIDLARNGKEAVEIYKKSTQKPAIIIMDHRMPVMNGIDAMIEILGYDNTVKVVFSSADDSVENLAFSKGAEAFLKKPFDIYEFRNTILNLLN